MVLFVLCVIMGGLVWGGINLLGFVFSLSGLLGGSSDLLFSFLFDDVSLVCSYMLFCCGLLALFYSGHYFGSDSSGLSLFYMIVSFLGVMGILLLSASFMFSLICWEYLGLVSFFLILFYSKSASIRAAVVTLVASRFGDVGLFIIVAWGLSGFKFLGVWMVFMILLVVLTKSACYPFMSWLLEAMRAPTPVSSLVHSSTLVAAGMWFLLRYEYIFSGLSSSVLIYLCMISMIISGGCALYFEDLKKIVALSTCKNISWCLLFFMCGDYELCLLQLLTHGVCKCYLFMSVGDLMSCSGSSQLATGVYLSRYLGGFSSFIQVLLVGSLCGFPFMGVYFSKHLFLSDCSYIFSGVFLVGILFGVFLSYAYSFRLAMVLLRGFGGLFYGFSSSFGLLVSFSVLGSLLKSWGLGLLEESLGLSVLSSLSILVIQMVSFLVGFWVYSGLTGVLAWSSSLCGGDCVVGGSYLRFCKILYISVLGFYRWEVDLAGLLVSILSGFKVSSNFIFSMKFLACLMAGGLVFLIFMS